MAARFFLVSLVALGLVVISAGAKRNRDEQREDQAVREAQKGVDEAQKTAKQREQSVREALSKLRSAAQARQTAASAVKKVEDRLEEKHADSTGLKAARAKLQIDQTALDEKSAPVLEKLRKQDDYRSAEAAVAKAKTALSPANEDLDTDRAAAAHEYAKALEKLSSLERWTLDRETALKPLLAKVAEDQVAIQAARRRFDAAVEKDPELKAARDAAAKARKAEDDAEGAVAAVQRELAAARSKLATAQQNLQRKRAIDARDGNRVKVIVKKK